jgi:hypothetical protein
MLTSACRTEGSMLNTILSVIFWLMLMLIAASFYIYLRR